MYVSHSPLARSLPLALSRLRTAHLAEEYARRVPRLFLNWAVAGVRLRAICKITCMICEKSKANSRLRVHHVTVIHRLD
jgi:hypothetical protein